MTFGWGSFPKEEFGVQVSKFFRRGVDSFFWHCPACEEMHPLPDSWKFDGNFDRPTFDPSFKHSWSGDIDGKSVTKICHYTLVNGVVNFCPDSTHKLAGSSIPLPELPEIYRD